MSGSQNRGPYKGTNIFRSVTGHSRKDGRVRPVSSRNANKPVVASLILSRSSSMNDLPNAPGNDDIEEDEPSPSSTGSTTDNRHQAPPRGIIRRRSTDGNISNDASSDEGKHPLETPSDDHRNAEETERDIEGGNNIILGANLQDNDDNGDGDDKNDTKEDEDDSNDEDEDEDEDGEGVRENRHPTPRSRVLIGPQHSQAGASSSAPSTPTRGRGPAAAAGITSPILTPAQMRLLGSSQWGSNSTPEIVALGTAAPPPTTSSTNVIRITSTHDGSSPSDVKLPSAASASPPTAAAAASSRSQPQQQQQLTESSPGGAKGKSAAVVRGGNYDIGWLGWRIPLSGRNSQLKALTKPMKEPEFPVLPSPASSFPEAVGDEALLERSAMNPSDSRIRMLQTGLLCRSIRGGSPWCLRYTVLTETGLHFFSGANGEFLNSHDSHLPLSTIKEVRELPETLGNSKQHVALEVSLHRSNEKVKLCAFDEASRAKWKDSLQKALEALAETTTGEAMAAMPVAAEDPERQQPLTPAVLWVSSGPASEDGPSSSNRVLCTSPPWSADNAIAAELRADEELRVWLSDGTVCCIRPDQVEQRWFSAESGSRMSPAPHYLEHKLSCASGAQQVGAAGGPGIIRILAQMCPSLTEIHQQVAAALVLLFVLPLLVAMGWAPPSFAYWAATVIAAAAAASVAAKELKVTGGTVHAELRLIGCRAPATRVSSAEAMASPDESKEQAQITRTLSLGVETIPEPDADKLAQLKAKYPDQSEVKLARFLIARKGDLDAAAVMYEKHKALRELLEPVAIPEVLPLMRADFMHFLGFARDRTPLVVFKIRNLSGQGDAEHLMKLLLRACDLGAELRPDLQCLTLLLDYKDFSLRKNFDLAKMNHISNVLNGSLPEVLRRCFIVNAPTVFQMVWKILSKLLADTTTDKIRILQRHEWPDMLTFVEETILPTEYGGAFPETYDASVNTETSLDWGHVPVPKGWPPSVIT